MVKKVKCAEWNNLKNEFRPKVRYWVPAAAMDKKDLIEELHLLQQRGFGGVEVVTLSMLPDEILTGDECWGTEKWNEMVQTIADTTEELGMTMDLANGPMWPISMPTIKSADDPAALYELTYGIITCPADGNYIGKLPDRRTIHKEGTPKLISLMAYQELSEKVLKKDSYVDLMDTIYEENDELYMKCSLPSADSHSRWLIFAFYSQPAVHKTGNDQYYVIDHLSKEGAKACEKYWDSIFEQYPIYPSMESFFCDSLEYQVMMDWTPNLIQEFEKKRGYSILPYLPFVGLKVLYPESDVPEYQLEDKNISDMINCDYFETITQCYCENHLHTLQKMAEKYGKSIRYQVAYNKPFEGERCPLYVEIPENEALGRPAMDYQKTMASAAHLGRKKRYSFECAAEFGNAYGQTYDDLMWWVKRSLMSGMNAQVLHGASYSGSYHGKYATDGHMNGITWPGYDGFGKVVSNEWSRTLSMEDARGCLDAITRLNTIFRKKAKVDCAIYRQSYANDGLGSEFCFYPDNGILSNHGYSYETISPFLLNLPVCKVTDGILDKDGVGYKCLIIPEINRVSIDFLLKVKELLAADFTIIWQGKKPEYPMYFLESEDQRNHWELLLSNIWNSSKLIHTDDLTKVPELLKNANIFPDIYLDAQKDIVTATRCDDDVSIRYYALYAFNRVHCTPDTPNPDELACSALYEKGTTKGSYQRPGRKSKQTISIRLKGNGQVSLMNPWDATKIPLPFLCKDGYMCGNITIEEDELLLFSMDTNKTADEQSESIVLASSKNTTLEKILPIHFDTLVLQEFLPDTPSETSFLRSHFSEKKTIISLKELQPWRKLDASLEKFAGKGTYKGSVSLAQYETGQQYVLYLGNVQDTFHVEINGQRTDFPDQVMKKVDIAPYLAKGENTIEVEVYSNLYNHIQNTEDFAQPPFPLPYVEKDYGIWNNLENQCCLIIK